MRMISKLLTATALAAAIAMPAAAKDLQKIGISVGLLGNPFFVATIKGIEDRAKEINPNVQVTSVSADYDLNKQVSQIDSFIAAGVDIIMLNASTPRQLHRPSRRLRPPALSSPPLTCPHPVQTSPS